MSAFLIVSGGGKPHSFSSDGTTHHFQFTAVSSPGSIFSGLSGPGALVCASRRPDNVRKAAAIGVGRMAYSSIGQYHEFGPPRRWKMVQPSPAGSPRSQDRRVKNAPNQPKDGAFIIRCK